MPPWTIGICSRSPNVAAHNRDDHSRNFAFLMDEHGTWRPSPAYDLTFSPGPGGQHTMLVAGEGRAPDASHLRAVAKAVGLRHAERIIDEVRTAIGRFKSFADQAGVPVKLRGAIARALGLTNKKTRTPTM